MKLKHTVLLIMMSCMLYNYTVAQNIFSKTFFNTGKQHAYSFTELPDSGFILVGDRYLTGPGWKSFMMRTDKYGDSLWTRRDFIGEFIGIEKTWDTNLIVSGLFDITKPKVQFAKINFNGDTLSLTTTGYVQSIGFTGHVLKDYDGGFIIRSVWCSDYDLLKLDSNLQIMWHVSVPNMPYGGGVYPDPFGGYVAFGSGYAPQQPYEVERLDSAGNVVWENHYGSQDPWDTQVYYPKGLVFLPDSNYMLGTDGKDFQLFKINRTSGDTMWTKTYDTSGFNRVNCIDSIGNGKYIASIDGYLVLLDENGDSIWKKPPPLFSFAIQQFHRTLDGGIAMCGYIANPNYELIAFAKIDTLGNTVSTSIFNPDNNFAPFSFYPNPARDEIFINAASLATEKNVVFTLSDMQGRMVLQQVYENNTAISISVIPAGLYIATLRGKEKELRGKVMVEK